MSDLISRQAAIDALADYIHNVDKVMGTGHLTADDCKDAAASVFEELPSAQPKVEKDTNVPINDCINRQAAIDGADAIIARDTSGNNDVVKAMTAWKSYVEALPSAQPGITLESAIDYLHSIGWMQEHDRTLTESAQPEIIRCKDCKFFVSNMEWCEADDEHPTRPDAFCSWAERRDG